MAADVRTIDALVAEIGSTTTSVTAFDGLAGWPETTPRLLGQGVAPTSVADGDVRIGLDAARAQLESTTGPLEPGVTLATIIGSGRSAHDGARPDAEDDGHGGSRGGARRGGCREVSDCRAPARPRPCSNRGGETEPRPARRRRRGRRLDTVLSNAQRLTGLSARPIVVYAGNLRSCRRGPGSPRARGLPVRVTRTSTRPSTSSISSRPGGDPRRFRGPHHACARHGAHPRVRDRAHPADARRRAGGRRGLARRSAIRRRRRRRRDDRRPLGHRRQPGVRRLSVDPQPHAKRTVEGDLGTFVSAGHVAATMAAGGRRCPRRPCPSRRRRSPPPSP